MSLDPFICPLSRRVWQTKYRFTDSRGEPEADIAATWQRVARAVSEAEAEPALWRGRFFDLLDDFKFLPGGRILAGAGTGRRVTLANCFVMGTVEDSIDGIFQALKEAALTLQQGGGVGYDFSSLRPAGSAASGAGNKASGPVSFMHVWDSMCATLLATGYRRGAMMGVLRCDHPDVEAFIEAKREPDRLRHFNLSVAISDAFMEAVRQDAEWPLVFPEAQPAAAGACDPSLERRWPGYAQPVRCRVMQRVSARVLWDRIMQTAYACAEPGVLFIDRINRLNPLAYRECIHATNPCAEVPMPAYGACNLGSLNLTRYVVRPFTGAARVDHDALAADAALAVRFLDNIVDVSQYPLRAQQHEAHATRRIGLGITGLGDALALLGLDYASAPARDQAAAVMRTVSEAAYRASLALAREKGPFPQCDPGAHAHSDFVRRLPAALRADVAEHGLRNSHLIAVAPAGSISVLANNVSSGMEPIFALTARRRVRQPDGGIETYAVDDPAWREWRAAHGRAVPPAFFRTALQVPPDDQLAMQAALQPHVDQGISKTINVSSDYPLADFRGLYLRAYELGLKGCTAYRPNPVTGAVLSADDVGCDGLVDRCAVRAGKA